MRLRFSWTWLFSILLFVGVLALVWYSWPTLQNAWALMLQAQPGWLLLGVLVLCAGFIGGGQIYGRVLRMMGYCAPRLWLTTAALVSALISQAIPAGTVASYAFLTTSLRRRGIPSTSVALLASLELITWLGGMMVLFSYGLIYKLLVFSESVNPETAYPAIVAIVVVMGSFTFVATRPIETLHRWTQAVAQVTNRLFRHGLSVVHLTQIVVEIDAHRRLITERPRRIVALVCLQVIVFALHSMALMVILIALGEAVSPFGVMAAYGLALVVSTFTALPGGGGAVEVALTLALTVEGVPADAALGATLIFRLLSFWLLLPIGALSYRILTAEPRTTQL